MRSQSLFLASFCDADDKVGDCGPKKRVEGVHRKQVRERQQDRGEQSGKGCQKHCPALPAQLAGEQAGEKDGCSAGEGRQQAKRPERCADGVLEKPG